MQRHHLKSGDQQEQDGPKQEQIGQNPRSRPKNINVLHRAPFLS